MSSLLVHYCEQRDLLLATNASPCGVGAVLSHCMEDGSEKLIAYASWSLSTAERPYSQLNKEALAIIFVVTKFRQYLPGQHFTILSDHKPLSYLFAANPPVPSTHIQRWSLLLIAYDYSMLHRPGKAHANADMLSGLPLSTTPTNTQPTGDTVLLFECLQVSPLNVSDIHSWTDCDPYWPRYETL